MTTAGVDCVKRAPERVQSITSRREDLIFGGAIGCGVLSQPVTPRLAMAFIGFFMDGEVRSALRVADAVEAVETLDFGRGDLGDLGFVGVKSRDRLSDGTIGADVAERVDDILRTGQRRGIGYVVFAYAESRAEIAPQLRVRARWVFLFCEILQNDRLE